MNLFSKLTLYCPNTDKILIMVVSNVLYNKKADKTLNLC